MTDQNRPPAVRVPDDHPLVTALAAQKQKVADLQAQVDQAPKAAADAVRGYLVDAGLVDANTAENLLTGDSPVGVLQQMTAAAAIANPAPQPASAPLLGTTVRDGAPTNADFARALFDGPTLDY